MIALIRINYSFSCHDDLPVGADGRYLPVLDGQPLAGGVAAWRHSTLKTRWLFFCGDPESVVMRPPGFRLHDGPMMVAYSRVSDGVDWTGGFSLQG